MFIIGLILCLSSLNYQCIEVEPDPILYFDTEAECEIGKNNLIEELIPDLNEKNEFTLLVGKCILIPDIKGA